MRQGWLSLVHRKQRRDGRVVEVEALAICKADRASAEGEAGAERQCARDGYPWYIGNNGEMAEWFKAAVLKTAVGASLPWVRIPLSPPVSQPLAVRKLSLRQAAG